jgi:hypothetical protein
MWTSGCVYNKMQEQHGRKLALHHVMDSKLLIGEMSQMTQLNWNN